MASGDSLLILPPLAGEPTATVYAQIGLRNLHPTIDFDPTTQESIVFSAWLPRNYSGGGLTVSIVWATNAVAGNVQFLAQIERMDSTTDLDADSFAATQSTGTLTVPATAGAPATQTVAFTSGAQMDSLAAGEPFRIKILRDPATDTCANDVQVLMVEIKET